MLSISVDNKQLEIKIKQISKLQIGKIADYKTGLLAQIQKQVSSNFANQQSGDGKKWQRLISSTVAQKIKRGFPPTPLVRTGSLQRAVNNLSAIESNQGRSLIIGIADDKIKRIASYQQLGTKDIPSRPFLTVKVRISDIIARTIIDKEIAKIKQTLK